MQMTGEQVIAAPRAKVWEALNDPEALRQAIPGCQSLERDGADRFTAVAEVKIGPIGARFKGNVQLSDIDAPNGYTITGSGNGGVAGNAKGGAKVRLSDAPGGGTLVSYTVDAEVGGRMAQLGGPIIDATARNLAAKFFARFGDVVSGAAAPGAAAPVQGAAPAASAPSRNPVKLGGTGLWGWVAALLAALLVGYYLGAHFVSGGIVSLVLALLVIVAAAAYESGKRSGSQ